jgi:hypothetical protein
VEASASGAFPFMRTTSGLVSGVARGFHVCLPLKATIDRAGSPLRSRHNGVARCTTTILIILISDAPPESANQSFCPVKIFNFVPSNDARNVGDGSHSWIASRRRARRPSVLCHSLFIHGVTEWKPTKRYHSNSKTRPGMHR